MTGQYYVEYLAFVAFFALIGLWCYTNLKGRGMFKRLTRGHWALIGMVYCFTVYGKPGAYPAVCILMLYADHKFKQWLSSNNNAQQSESKID